MYFTSITSMLEKETMCLSSWGLILTWRARFHPKSRINISERFVTAKRKKLLFGAQLLMVTFENPTLRRITCSYTTPTKRYNTTGVPFTLWSTRS